MDPNPYRSPKAISNTERKPVKVRAYGLIPLTRNAYLTLQIVLAVAAVAVLFAVRPIIAVRGHPIGFVNDYFYTIILVMLALEGIETFVMLRKFRKAEREQEVLNEQRESQEGLAE